MTAELKEKKKRESLRIFSLQTLDAIEREERERMSLAALVEATSVIKCEPWQLKLYDRLAQIPFQTGQRLSVKVAPQSGKTTGGQRLPAFYLGHLPLSRIRVLTFNETHSVDQYASVIRQVMLSDYYRQTFTALRGWTPDSGRMKSWSTPVRAALGDGQWSFDALGVQVGTIGAGAELYLFDDVYSSKEDAFSERTNEKMRDVYLENIMPRLGPRDNVLSLGHPWNEGDFSAFLLDQCGFTEIRIPSICDSENDFAGRPYIAKALSVTYEEYLTLSKDEQIYLEQAALTPRQPLAHLLRMRDGYRDDDGKLVAGIGDAAFESQHQGNPKARGGSRFRLEDFHYVPDAEHKMYFDHGMEDEMYFSYWDLGGSEAESSDNTANWVLHKTPGGIFTFVDHCVFKLREAERDERIYAVEREHFKKYRNHNYCPFVEWQFGIGTDITTHIVRKCAAMGMQTDRVRRPLAERVIPLAIAMQSKNVRFLKAEWNREAQQEFLDFRDGKTERRNDRVSAAAGAFNCASEYRIA